MPRPVLLALVIIAGVLIVFGRLNHRNRWGNWVALGGFAVLAVAAILSAATR